MTALCDFFKGIANSPVRRITKEYTLTKEEFLNFFDTYITALDCWDGNNSKWIFNLRFQETRRYCHSKHSKDPKLAAAGLTYNFLKDCSIDSNIKFETTKPEDVIDLMTTRVSYFDDFEEWKKKVGIPESIKISLSNGIDNYKTNYPLVLSTDDIENWREPDHECRYVVMFNIYKDIQYFLHNAEKWTWLGQPTWILSCKFIDSPIEFKFTVENWNTKVVIPDGARLEPIKCEIIQRVDTNLLESIYNRIKITKNNNENKSDILG
jgi:hypothetical protein